MPLAEQGAPCPHCLGKGLYPFDKIVRLGTFRDPLKHLIHRMKYHRHWPLAEHLADRFLEMEQAKGLLSETDRLLPVPLHRWRQVGRGYNQAQVIAARLSKRCRIKMIHPVVRLRNTETQTHLHSRAKREENLRGAFGLVNAKVVTGKHLIVVDDVMTTGATLQAVGRVLKQARPASLCAIVLAVADPRGRDFQVI